MKAPPTFIVATDFMAILCKIQSGYLPREWFDLRDTNPTIKVIWVFVPGHSGVTCNETANQARNQLGTPGGAKSFPRGGQIFWTMSNIFKICPTHFSRGGEKFQKGGFAPLRPPWLWACRWHVGFELLQLHSTWLVPFCLKADGYKVIERSAHHIHPILGRNTPPHLPWYLIWIITLQHQGRTCQSNPQPTAHWQHLLLHSLDAFGGRADGKRISAAAHP